ncbi:TetR/AcrR family transcriptional regulator [Actinomadura xylanilytica]|uniref:TetR/AcrR family transcriptional regulator n=1 Tax=Actinomadura xylanilytica TaxID=887459 RepID=UPI00255AA8AA|nr:TetR/AcrR family transcriptional regulator [Actinomadura xylanilytica]MDL4777630.1 TetR/AcrR family transcriptional regulator [Actinomadura xylanilytica]
MRADAVRNERAILLAAHRLICENGVDQVSMNDIAAEAGVGKGTLFRRFGDRAGLVGALFEQLTVDWETGALDRLADPAVPPLHRVLAFVTELFDRMVVPGRPLLRAMDGHHGEERIRHYRLWQEHLATVIGEFRPDGDFLAHAVLATPRGQFVDLLIDGGMTLDEVRTGVVAFTHTTLTGALLPPDLHPPPSACTG